VNQDFKKLREVCQIKPPKKEAKENLSQTDLVSFLPMSDLGTRTKKIQINEVKPLGEVVGSYTYFAENDVLLAKITPCFENGKLGIARNLVNGVGFGSSEYIVLRSKGEIDPDYLFYFLARDTFRENGSRVMTGAVGHKRIPKGFIEEYPIPIQPMPEQKRIVAILDEVFEGVDRAIANTKKNLTNTRELFESYLNTALSGKGKQWKLTTLGQNIDLLTGFPFKSSGYTKSEESIRLLRGDNIIPGSLRWYGVKKWPESEVQGYPSYHLQESDVVLAMDRPWITSGLKHAQISEKDLPCLLVQRVARLRGAENLENCFLLYLIGSHAFTQHVLGSQTGTGVPHISGRQIKSFKFVMPSLPEQRKLIGTLDNLKSDTQRLETIYEQKLTALNELKQSILQKAFSGELTADTVMKEVEGAILA